MSLKEVGHRYLADMIKGYGISHVFYMEAILRYMLRDLEIDGVKLVMAHTENAAGYMADGYARATGQVGICMAQSIGAGNLVGGITDAYLACSPVLAITGKKIPALQKRNSYQEYDHTLLYEGITKYNADISDPKQLPYMFRQAMRVATTGKPRPVHLDVANNLGRELELASIEDTGVIDKAYGQCPAYRPAASKESVTRAAAAIAEAKKPVIVGGRGASVSGAGGEILALARKTDIPVVTTPDGKTLLNEDDPLWAGVNGEYGMDCANRTLANADLVIFIGTQTNDQSTCEWACPPAETKAIQIDIEPSELGRNYVDCISLLGDAKTVVSQLEAAVLPAKHDKWRAEVAVYVKDTLDDYAPLQHSNDSLIRPERLCYEVGKVLPDNAVLVSDTGYSAVWTATMLRMKATQDYYRAAGSLGWALPGSLGVKCGVGDRPVVCFLGDGGMYYHLSELETAMRFGINTVTVINNNGVLAQCSNDIKSVYMDSPQSGAKRFTFRPTNYTQLAKDFGCHAVRVTNAEQIGPAIQIALAAGKAAVVEVITDPDIYCQPAIKKGLRSMVSKTPGLD